MGFGMSFKVAPGVRIRASSRGVRTSIGPRGARVHVGAGRTTISSGAGPFTVWTGVGPNRSSRAGYRRSAGGAGTPSLAALQRQTAAAQRADEISRVMDLERSLLTLHLEEFPAAQRLIAPPPREPDVAALIQSRLTQALDGVPLLAWSRRRETKEWAHKAGTADADVQRQQAKTAQVALQRDFDEYWNCLTHHDQATVHQALENAFEDNQSPAACIDVDTDDGIHFATVVIIFGPPDLVPERQPALTPTGRPTLHKRTKSERNNFYVGALGSTVLATVREGFAVAPSVSEFRVVVIRKDPQAPNPESYLEWIYAAQFPRDWVAAIDWARVDPAELLLQAPGSQIQRRGAAGNVAALPVANQPGLQDIIAAVRTAGELAPPPPPVPEPVPTTRKVRCFNCQTVQSVLDAPVVACAHCGVRMKLVPH